MAKNTTNQKTNGNLEKNLQLNSKDCLDSENVYKLAKRPITQCKNGQRI